MDQNFRNALVGTFVGAATVAATVYVVLKMLLPLVPSPAMPASEPEEDRPPVVVSSGGSVDVEAQPISSSLSGPGAFLADPISGLLYHVHAGAAPVGFYVTLTNYVTCSDSKTPPFVTDAITVTYAKNNQTQSFKLYRSDLNGLSFLTIDLNTEKPEWDATKKHAFRLKHADNWKLRSVTIPGISTCTLREDYQNDTQRPTIKVQQLH